MMITSTTTTNQDTLNKLLAERFSNLPKTVQDAITDASVEKRLRALAQKHKLHLDQWVLLENEIMLTLLGLEETQNLVSNVMKAVRVDEVVANAIVSDIAVLIFEPIRNALQQGLPVSLDDRKTAKSEKIEEAPEAPENPSQDDVLPQAEATPAEIKPNYLVSSEYKSGTTSRERKTVDPYREAI